jgi:hypothetical protein
VLKGRIDRVSRLCLWGPQQKAKETLQIGIAVVRCMLRALLRVVIRRIRSSKSRSRAKVAKEEDEDGAEVSTDEKNAGDAGRQEQRKIRQRQDRTEDDKGKRSAKQKMTIVGGKGNGLKEELSPGGRNSRSNDDFARSLACDGVEKEERKEEDGGGGLVAMEHSSAEPEPGLAGSSQSRFGVLIKGRGVFVAFQALLKALPRANPPAAGGDWHNPGPGNGVCLELSLPFDKILIAGEGVSVSDEILKRPRCA